MSVSVRFSSVLLAVVAMVACTPQTDSSSVLAPDQASFARAPSGSVTIGTVVPSESPRGVTLDVQINGSGFDASSQATLPLHGAIDPRVHVNSTRYVKSSQVVANVTITGDAPLDMYDVVVTAAAGGKKGIGTEAFIVELKAEVLATGYRANDVNAAGETVGLVTNANCGVAPRPTLWRADGTVTTLNISPYCGGNPMTINASGVILTGLSGGAANMRGLLIPSGGSYTLQTLPPAPDGYQPLTNGSLNDNNEIIGWRQITPKVYWYSPSTGWVDVQIPAGSTSCQTHKAINNVGEFAARCVVNGVSVANYYARYDAAPVPLPRGSLTGDAIPIDMNDAGVIVGTIGGKGVRWRPTHPGYALDIFPTGSPTSIASDGTMAGSVPRNGSSGSPVIFYSPTSYQILGLTAAGRWGSADGIVFTGAGYIVVGTEGAQKALRWKSPGL